MIRDEQPFSNRNSPPSHRRCTNPLCLTCLMSERDNYTILRSWPSESARLYLVRREADVEEKSA